MAKRPLIGICTQTQEPIAGQTPVAWIMGQTYIRVLTSCGAVPWLIPLVADDEATMAEIYDRLDGVFLTGGVDVDPSYYGEQKHELCGRTDMPRDDTEIWLVRRAKAEGKPVLGVCRGFQVMNVACGGSLFQDVSEQHPNAIKHDYFPGQKNQYARSYLAHEAQVDSNTTLHDLLRHAQVPINSMHHQGIKQLAPGLRATAYASDGLIEAIETNNGGFYLGVQWHPEELAATDAGMRRLFEEFIAASTKT